VKKWAAGGVMSEKKTRKENIEEGVNSAIGAATAKRQRINSYTNQKNVTGTSAKTTGIKRRKPYQRRKAASASRHISEWRSAKARIGKIRKHVGEK